MLQRAGVGKQYYLRARAYAYTLRNFRVQRGRKQQRIHIHTGRPSDFSQHPPIAFWTRCQYPIERAKRGGVGGDRYDEGHIIGMTSNGKYELHKLQTNTIVVRRDVRPVDEMDIIYAGIPSCGVDVETSTDAADFEALQTLQPPPPKPTVVKVVAGYEPLPNGFRL